VKLLALNIRDVTVCKRKVIVTIDSAWYRHWKTLYHTTHK